MTWEVAVRVAFVQSGGIVGLPQECDLDTRRLSEADARELELLVAESELPESGEYLSRNARDLRLYEIRVERDSHTVTVRFDDETLPERARPLVSFLRRNATPRGGA